MAWYRYNLASHLHGLFFLFIISTMFLASTKYAFQIPRSVRRLFGLHCFTMLVIVCLMVLYIVHIVKSTFEKQEMKVIWLILVLMGGMIAMPVYWYMNIWHSKQITVPPEPLESNDAT